MDEEKVRGSIERITYYNEENYFAVATLIAEGGKSICLVGTMPAIQVGEQVAASGNFIRHPKHGLQFEVKTFEFELPKNAIGIEKFLASGAIRGIGPNFAKKIVSKFKENTLDIIANAPEKLAAIEGLGPKRRDAIHIGWKEHTAIQEVFIFLANFGVSRIFARKILKTWGHEALQKIRANPYLLAKEVHGIGFLKADAIAKNVGFAHDSRERIAAGIDFFLYELAGNGHVCFPLEEFISRAEKVLLVGVDLIRLEIGRQYQAGQIEMRKIGDTFFIWAKTLFASEQGIRGEIIRLQKAHSNLRVILVDKAIEWAEGKQHIHFGEEQKKALALALENKVSIITGGPGTGKSTITRALCGITSKLSNKIILAAPTGRAAKRLSEITSRFASTIHRLLKFDFTTGKFKHDRQNPLDVDLLVLDETSMIDTYLMYQLLRAVPSTAKVVFIGDADQLPSIGPGNVLRDFIKSEKIATAKLSLIFRQAAGSKIITNAHRINEGKMPYVPPPGEPSDFLFFDAPEAEDARRIIINLVTKEIPSRYGYDPKRDIQVLAPMRKGPCGIEILNHELQAILTPGQNCGLFRPGDKVIQLRNNYQKEVFNGDVGYVESIDPATSSVIVEMDERPIVYDLTDLDELALAYAVSIHKYQGSESPVIVMPVHTSHFKMLTRNLIYTGITRAKKLIAIVGTKKAMIIGIQNQEIDNRYTGLRAAFQEMVAPGGRSATSSNFIVSPEEATSTIPSL
jgi:exodeoxyribonuclease V alpha subunit